MHPLHDYVAKQLAEKLSDRRVVVWYDERGEFQPFVDEMRGGRRAATEPVPVAVEGAKASLVEYAGSLFELRSVVEPLVSDEKPNDLIIYIPGLAHDTKASVLMELEKAGRTWKPELNQLAKNVLLQMYTLGVVDEMLPGDRKVSYDDLARAAAGNSGEGPPSILKSIFHDASGNDALLAAWLVSAGRDAEIVNKDATGELTKLVKARLGLDLAPDSPLAKLRAVTLRYVLAGEFRLDLSCDAPPTLDRVAQPRTKADEVAIRELARRLRGSFPQEYAALANRVEKDLNLRATELSPSALGAIDTFRFEERALLRHAGRLIANGKFSEALTVVSERQHSFWLDRDYGRKAQWEAVRRMAELGTVAVQVQAAVDSASCDAGAWVDAYTRNDGWYRLDQAQRRLEAWVVSLDEEPEEQPLGVVRRAYEQVCQTMANGFTKALATAAWTVPEVSHQTRIFNDVVCQQPQPMAYILVDALRFEMGLDLAQRLPTTSEVAVRAVVGALPTITPIGMAALMPGASASFSVVEQDGKLGARIDDSFLPDATSRKKFAAARVPQLVDLTLDELLGLQLSKLRKKIGGAQVVVVRSQEIDHAGEAGFAFHARQVMDAVIDNLVRALRKLATAGIERAVVTADHGHLFFAADRDESMRTDPPGGKTVELHRRCWIGRGGSTPPGCVRVAASALGYASDLDFVFPTGSGVFRVAGDLAFHHGGPSLQELIVPVLTVRTTVSKRRTTGEHIIRVSGAPTEITNRMVTCQVSSLLGAVVCPILVSAGRKVGSLFGIHGEAEMDRHLGTVEIPARGTVTLALLLNDASVKTTSLVILEPSTDAELYRSPADITIDLGV